MKTVTPTIVNRLSLEQFEIQIVNPFASYFGVVNAWVQRVQFRTQLSRQSQRSLLDSGWIKNDVLLEVNKPFWKA
jgi:uncharacterized protein YjiS (DUF1127 family)